MKECKYCSRKHERGMEKCPAYGKTCTKCSNQNHFSSVCLQTVSLTTPRKVQPQRDLQESKPKVHAVHKDLHPQLRMNFGSCHSLNRSMLSAATRAEFMQPWKLGTKLLKCRWTLEYLAMSRPAATCLLMLKSRKQCENLLPTPSPN